MADCSDENNVELEDLEQMKVYRPTEEEFTSPVEYFEKLYQEGAHEYGCVKVIPPKSFAPPLAFDMESD